jgi:hypothetical protein
MNNVRQNFIYVPLENFNIMHFPKNSVNSIFILQIISLTNLSFIIGSTFIYFIFAPIVTINDKTIIIFCLLCIFSV